MQEPDPAALRRAIDGDATEFAELVRAYQAPVWRFLRHLVSDAGLAEDLTQETFLRVYQRLSTYRFECRFTTWMFQVARNAAIDAGRSATRRRRLETTPLVPTPPSDPVQRAEIEAALASLAEPLRAAVTVVEVLGLRYREAAIVLGIPEGTVKSRVFAARRQLTRWYQVDDVDEEDRDAL